MENSLKPTSPSADLDTTDAMLQYKKDAENAAEAKVYDLTLQLRGVKSKKFKEVVERLKYNAKAAGLEFIRAELKAAGKTHFGDTMNVTNVDPSKLEDPNFKGGTIGPKVIKKKPAQEKPGKLSPEELEKMGFNKPEWDRMTRDERESRKKARAAGQPVDDDDDEV